VAPKLSVTPGRIHSPAPDLGQHSDEIYRSLLDFDSARIGDLRARGII
jgi:formyl-CoA transferase